MLEGVDNEQGHQGQVNGASTGDEGEDNQRDSERGGAQGEAQQQTADGEFTLEGQTNAEIIAQIAAQAEQERTDEHSGKIKRRSRPSSKKRKGDDTLALFCCPSTKEMEADLVAAFTRRAQDITASYANPKGGRFHARRVRFA